MLANPFPLARSSALLAGETTTMRHRRKPIKAHTSHRQGEANTLATAPAISL
jgi:hypothetical protein